MIDDPRGNGRRGGQLALARFLASPAQDAIKAAVQTILPPLARYTALDEAVIRSNDPALLEQILALTPAGLDFFRLLRDEKPAHPRHSRQHVSAALRAKCRVPRGQITPADFPARASRAAARGHLLGAASLPGLRPPRAARRSRKATGA